MRQPLRAQCVDIDVQLPFIRQVDDVFCQQEKARPYVAAATQRALRGVGLQQLPWPA